VTHPSEQWQLDTRRVGRQVHVFDRLDSTNSHAAALAADPANDGLAVLAREQTAGRGQYGRTWLCPAGAGVLLSVLVFPPPSLRRPALLTAWAAVSVCEAIRTATGLQARIKWPNDVLVHGRKVCGILIEQALRSGGDWATVAGMGLNVNQPDAVFAEEGLTEAGSLAVFTGRTRDTDDMARRLLAQLDEEYNRLCQGDLVTLEACWKWRLGLLGKRVVVEGMDGQHHRGRLVDLGWAGVELRRGDGDRVCLQPEAVRHLRPT
jgi:BirA family biotin operon repressor/biotin-[acetyl-CoA-carboxylase] ligase